MRSSLIPTIFASASTLLFASAGLAQTCSCETDPENCELCPQGESMNITAVTLSGPGSEKADALFKQGDFEGACEIYADFIGDEASGQDWFQYGYALHVTGNIAEAKKAHKQAAGFANYRPIALYNLGCALALEGDTDGAYKALHQSAKVGFTAYETVVDDSDLESIRGDERWSDYTGAIKKNAKVAEKRRQLDFWVGNWSVQLEDGTEVGKSHISSDVSGNCIIEDWKSERYGSGKSMTFYDAQNDGWRQTYINATGEILDMKGYFEDGMITFWGKDNEKGKFKNTLVEENDGRLVQTMLRADDEGEWTKEWTVYYAPIEGKERGYEGEKKEKKEKKNKQISALR